MLNYRSKALDIAFGYKKAFEKKLKVFKKDIGDERFRYFSNLKRHINDLQNDDRTDCQSLQKLFLNITGLTDSGVFRVWQPWLVPWALFEQGRKKGEKF